MNKNQTILEEVYCDIKNIKWTSKTVENKALNFMSNFITVSLHKFNTLLEPQHLSNGYWNKVLGKTTNHNREIKKQLISNNILNEFKGLYKKDKRVKSYIINNKYINNNFNHIIIADSFYNELETNDIQSIEKYTKKVINNIKLKKNSNVSEKGEIVLDMINTVKIIDNSKENKFIDVSINENKYRYEIHNAIKFAKKNNYKLIQYGNKNIKYYFVRDIEEWKNMKAIDLSILYNRQLFDIENNIIYAKRNKTNNRLDTNLTNLKSDLWKYLILDGEEFVEIDISNAQFAILSNIMNVSAKFHKLCVNGELYEYIAEQLNITRKEAKLKMFRIAFDKVKEEQDDIREIFPKTMKVIDEYKTKFGYKSLSNILQKTEAKIMIDNVLFKLMKKYDIVSVHDSIRCKKSLTKTIFDEMNEIFNDIKFDCKLKLKTNTEEQKHTINSFNCKDNMNTTITNCNMIDKEIIESLNKIYKESKDEHSIYTPLNLCRDMLSSISTFDGKNILVISNLEFLITLKRKGVDMNTVHYSTNCDIKKTSSNSIRIRYKQYL